MKTPSPFSLILFFLLSQFALYLAVCGNLNEKVGYPFSNISNPECGLYVINCNEPTPVIDFKGEKRYNVIKVFNKNNTIVVNNQFLQKSLHSEDCNFANFSLSPVSNSVSFELKSLHLTLFKCPKSSSSPLKPQFGGFEIYERCKDYVIYYGYEQQPSVPFPAGKPPPCSVIQLPLSEPPTLDYDLFTLLGADFTIEWHLLNSTPIIDANVKKGAKKIIIITAVAIGIVIIIVGTYFSWRWMANHRDNSSSESLDPYILGDNQDFTIFSFEELIIATNNFSESNKLGQGGFGSVYKGELPDRQVIAIKRLSKSSGQGLQEFKNEVVVISKLQHKNLVSLLGCCIAGEEKILIYEYMPNNSLDTYLFGPDPTKRRLLDWGKRFQIIEGISRGILYLHRDSRLKVIHRDLKPSNVLLDEELNPKISDFGMARIFGSKELQANTNRVVGTYGYMSPEYAMEGQFSEKSDVFSFGVLLLEIVSGRRNTSFYNHDQSLSLLKYAWLLWNENKIQSLVEPILSTQPHFELEIVRCIHVGLLCVQEFAHDRPTMLTTLSMLTSEIATLPTPKQPAFTQRLPSSHSSSYEHKTFSLNAVTLTSVGGR